MFLLSTECLPALLLKWACDLVDSENPRWARAKLAIVAPLAVERSFLSLRVLEVSEPPSYHGWLLHGLGRQDFGVPNVATEGVLERLLLAPSSVLLMRLKRAPVLPQPRMLRRALKGRVAPLLAQVRGGLSVQRILLCAFARSFAKVVKGRLHSEGTLRTCILSSDLFTGDRCLFCSLGPDLLQL